MTNKNTKTKHETRNQKRNGNETRKPTTNVQGKLETIHATVAVGNMDGLAGVGSATGSEMQRVMLNALLAAYRSVAPVPLYRGHTLYHPIDLSHKKLRVRCWPRRAGFGVTASPLVQQLCWLAGVRDATVKLSGRRRKHDRVAHTWLRAVAQGQAAPHDGVEGGGVYVREVYHRQRLPFGLTRGVDV